MFKNSLLSTGKNKSEYARQSTAKQCFSLMVMVLLLTTTLVPLHAQVSFGKAELLNQGWRFLRVDTAWNIRESEQMSRADFDDSHWRQVDLPHDWGIEQPMSPGNGSCQGYLPGGIGWYRTTLPQVISQATTREESVFVYFEGVYNHSEVYINGQLLGRRPSGFASFIYNLTPHLRTDGPNVLAVRVDHSMQNDSRWYTGSGIYRNVWLVKAPKVHFSLWGTAYRLKHIDSKKATLEIDIETTDDRTVREPMQLKATVQLHDAEGNMVASTTTTIGTEEKKTVMLTVKRPRRWSVDTPYLYQLTCKLRGGSQYEDLSNINVGLRTIDFSANHGFSLNGKQMKIKGVCLHDDAGTLGTAVPEAVWHRRLLELKSIGVNAIRMSHNPHAPVLYDLCDKLGLLVMDEASDEWELPKRKWLKGWNQGVPGFEGTYTFFDEWIERDVADMVRRDRHHPSIFMWSIGNEVDYPNDPYSHPVLDGDGTSFTQPVYGGYKSDQPNAERIGHIARRLATIVKGIDSSRPTTGALAGVVMSNATDYPHVVDVVGYNYTESRYDTDHQQYPNRVIYGSENRHDLAAWKAVSEREHIFGQFLWTGIDYLGESGTWPARGSSAGLLDLAGQRKPLGWYRAALWSTEPTCYIGSYPISNHQRKGERAGRHNQAQKPHPYATDTWNYGKGDLIRVVCFTNAHSARLLLNGQPVGSDPRRDADTDILYWDIDYQPGTLRCEADNGAAYEIETNSRPYALKVSTDSIAHIFIEVVDEEGRLVKQADNEVTLSLHGARLAGMENGNIMDNSVNGRRQANRLRVSGGRLVAYMKPVNEAKHIIISATSPLLQSYTIEIPKKADNPKQIVD